LSDYIIVSREISYKWSDKKSEIVRIARIDGLKIWICTISFVVVVAKMVCFHGLKNKNLLAGSRMFHKYILQIFSGLPAVKICLKVVKMVGFQVLKPKNFLTGAR